MPELRQSKLAYTSVVKTVKRVEKAIYREVAPLEIDAWITKEPLTYNERLKGEHKKLTVGSVWAELFDCAWMNFTGTVPPVAKNQHVVLLHWPQ